MSVAKPHFGCRGFANRHKQLIFPHFGATDRTRDGEADGMFKVRCTLMNFEKDEKKHPCHFNYIDIRDGKAFATGKELPIRHGSGKTVDIGD